MEKYRNVKWNKEIAVQRERNIENSQGSLRNRYEEEYSWQQTKTNDVPILKTVFFAALGLMVVGFIFFGSGLMFTNGIISSVNNHVNNAAKTTQLEIEQRNKAMAVELERLKLQKAEADLQRKKIEEDDKQTLINIREEQITKESKWKAFYKKPDNCSPPPTHQIRVECGNTYIRERAKFDDLYSKGKI